jgi:hypothetical protein
MLVAVPADERERETRESSSGCLFRMRTRARRERGRRHLLQRAQELALLRYEILRNGALWFVRFASGGGGGGAARSEEGLRGAAARVTRPARGALELTPHPRPLHLSLASVNSTCLLTTGSYLTRCSLYGTLRGFFLVCVCVWGRTGGCWRVVSGVCAEAKGGGGARLLWGGGAAGDRFRRAGRTHHVEEARLRLRHELDEDLPELLLGRHGAALAGRPAVTEAAAARACARALAQSERRGRPRAQPLWLPRWVLDRWWR